MNWSKYQHKIYEVSETDLTSDILIQAGAGSGKTSTIVELSRRLNGSNLFLAFNKSIIEELSTKLPYSTQASTLHSLGCRSLFAKYGSLKVSSKKTNSFIAKSLKRWEVPANKTAQAYGVVNRLVDLYRLTLCKSKEQLIQVALDTGIEFLDNHITYTLEVIQMLEKYNRNPQTIDFVDMIYLPATQSIRLPSFTNIFVDECQDLSNAQHLLTEKLAANSRMILVGDKFQSIYGFAGGNTESFNRILNRGRKTIELPLPICYRCPTEVVDVANQVYNVLESPDWAIKGEVRGGDIQEASSGDLIICRNLKPLFIAYFCLIKANKRANIKGEDIGQSLIKLIEPYRKCSLLQLFEELRFLLVELSNSLREGGIYIPKKHPSYESLSQKISAILILSDHYESVEQMISCLKNIFSDNRKKEEYITLCTIHKAKGLEAENVFLLNSNLIGKRAETPQQRQQERNLMYVAVTRSKNRLIYCSI